MLLTIPACQSTPCTLIATADATIKSGSNSEKNFGKIKKMSVEMNASQINHNQDI